MKTKQLANILIKILGLSVLVHSISGIVSGIVNVVQAIGAGSPGGYWIYPVEWLISAAIGFFLIILSRQVTELLFKNEDE